MINLPDGYKIVERVELMKDEKMVSQLIVITIVTAIIAIVMGIVITPFRVALPFGLASLLLLLPIYLVFIVIHELIHIICMKIFSPAKVVYGISWSYAHAGSLGYFTKRQHIIIGLSPVVIIGVFLLVFAVVLPVEWFWNIHILQVLNLSSAAGDIYMANYMRKQPSDALIKDEGPTMTIYHRMVDENRT